MTNVALYVRCSTQKQELDNQILALSKYCEQNGICNFETYRDFGVSGKKESRPGLDQLLKDCREGKISKVICFSFSRIGRSTPHLLKILNFLKDRNIDFCSLSEQVDTSSAAGAFFFTVIAALASYESACLSERVKAGLRRTVAQGTVLGRKTTINEQLVKQLLEKGGFSFAEIGKLAKCSKSSVWRISEKLKSERFEIPARVSA